MRTVKPTVADNVTHENVFLFAYMYIDGISIPQWITIPVPPLLQKGFMFKSERKVVT